MSQRQVQPRCIHWGEQRGALGREAGRRERTWDAAVSSHLPCEGEPIWRY